MPVNTGFVNLLIQKVTHNILHFGSEASQQSTSFNLPLAGMLKRTSLTIPGYLSFKNEGYLSLRKRLEKGNIRAEAALNAVLAFIYF